MDTLTAFARAAAEVGIPGVLVFLLLRHLIRTQERILSTLLNHHGSKLDRIADVLLDIRDALLRGGVYIGRSPSERKAEERPQGEEDC